MEPLPLPRWSLRSATGSEPLCRGLQPANPPELLTAEASASSRRRRRPSLVAPEAGDLLFSRQSAGPVRVPDPLEGARF